MGDPMNLIGTGDLAHPPVGRRVIELRHLIAVEARRARLWQKGRPSPFL